MADQPRSAPLTEAGNGLDPVAGTARWTAAMRALESARPDRLFDDPLAATLAGEPGRALQEQMGDSSNAAIAVRTRFFDDAITGLTAGPELHPRGWHTDVTPLSTAGTLPARNAPVRAAAFAL